MVALSVDLQSFLAAGVLRLLGGLYLAVAVPQMLRRVFGPRLPPKSHPLLDLPLPIIGPLINIVLFISETVQIARKERLGRVFRSPYLAGVAVNVCDTEGIKIAFTTRYEGKKVLGTQQIKSIGAMWGALALSNVSGTEHSRLKKLMHPSFSGCALRHTAAGRFLAAADAHTQRHI
eukprot:2710-Heterococcus_DN1.PRE.1